MNFREFHTSTHFVNKGKKKRKDRSLQKISPGPLWGELPKTDPSSCAPYRINHESQVSDHWRNRESWCGGMSEDRAERERGPGGTRPLPGADDLPRSRGLAARTDLALLPIGPLEAHGPHLPLGTDPIAARELCERAACDLAARGIECRLAPCFPTAWPKSPLPSSGPSRCGQRSSRRSSRRSAGVWPVPPSGEPLLSAVTPRKRTAKGRGPAGLCPCHVF
jgi:hypothetical protein